MKNSHIDEEVCFSTAAMKTLTISQGKNETWNSLKIHDRAVQVQMVVHDKTKRASNPKLDRGKKMSTSALTI